MPATLDGKTGTHDMNTNRKILIDIDLNSECFDELPSIELARVLNTLARMIDDEFLCGKNREKEIVDFHGNSIGLVKISENKK